MPDIYSEEEILTLLVALAKNVTDFDMPLENDDFKHDMADTIERIFPSGSDEFPRAKQLADALRKRIDNLVERGLIA